MSVFILWLTYYASDILRYLNDHLPGKELFIRFTARAFRKLLSVYVFSYFPFAFDDRILDLIVSVPDHCFFFTFWLEFGGTQFYVFSWISTSGRKFCRTLSRSVCITLVLN